jgi:hypothetical protein
MYTSVYLFRAMRDRRFELRVRRTAALELQWTDKAGRLQSRAANLVDISRTGACVQAQLPVEFGTLVSFVYENQVLMGKVQHCRRRMTHYEMGIEFNSDSRWSRSTI